MKFIAYLTLASLFLLGATANAHAATSTQEEFDWQQAWGKIGLGGANDEKINAENHQAKMDIKQAVIMCGSDATKIDHIKTYKLDFNGDQKTDYITDASPYFSVYSNDTCYVNICTNTDGCYLSAYITDDPTNIISDPKKPPVNCPAKPEDNTTCETSCPATINKCPGNFKYNMRAGYNERVLSWSIISADDFSTWKINKHYKLLNGNPVLAVSLNGKKCYIDEMTYNNNSCVKYYQYEGGLASGEFKDLYDNTDRTEGYYGNVFTYEFFNKERSKEQRGQITGNGFYQRLNAAGISKDGEPDPGSDKIGLQISGFKRTDSSGAAIPSNMYINKHVDDHGKDKIVTTDLICMNLQNASGNSYFVPMNTDPEFNSFLNNLPAGATATPCTLKLSDWLGDTNCDGVQIPYGQTVTIVAERFCTRSSSAYAPCQECIDAKVPGYEQGCKMQQQCTGTTCILTPQYVTSVNGDSSYVGKVTTLQECLDKKGFWKGIDFNRWSDRFSYPEWCQLTFSELCAGGVDCVAADTLIALTDSKFARADQIKAGDIILGFDKPHGKLKKAKVEKVTITQNQPMIRINDSLTMTSRHLAITSKGAMVADHLKVGEYLLLENGKKVKIEKISKEPSTGTVYNLKTEKGIGYIANGIRVLNHDALNQ